MRRAVALLVDVVRRLVRRVDIDLGCQVRSLVVFELKSSDEMVGWSPSHSLPNWRCVGNFRFPAVCIQDRTIQQCRVENKGEEAEPVFSPDTTVRSSAWRPRDEMAGHEVSTTLVGTGSPTGHYQNAKTVATRG